MDKIENNILDISHNYYKNFMNLENINGVGLGFKIINGIWTKEPCIHVLVEKKVEEKYLSKNNIIPKKYMGIKTDIIETGKISLYGNVGVNKDLKLRPLQGGCAISCRYLNIEEKMKTSSGTLGCIVTKQLNGSNRQYFILSNNHVLANFNDAHIGAPILQPQYSSKIGEEIARLTTFVELQTSYPDFEVENEVDAAIARIIDKSLISNKILEIGSITGVNKPSLELNIKKSGMKTGLTKGKITTVGATEIIKLNKIEKLIFKNTIRSDIYSDIGDSGSCVLNENNEVVGMINAGTKKGAYIHDINIVLEKFKVEIYIE